MRCTRLESLDRQYLNPIRWLPSVRSVPTSLRASDIPIRCTALLLYGSRSYIPRRGVRASGTDPRRGFLRIRRLGLYSGIRRSGETHFSRIHDGYARRTLSATFSPKSGSCIASVPDCIRLGTASARKVTMSRETSTRRSNRLTLQDLQRGSAIHSAGHFPQGGLTLILRL
jgi:hypothetical protein